MKILITGSAGFIGFHLCHYLLKKKYNSIVGVDSINNYYDINIKNDRLKILKRYPNFKFHKINIANKNGLRKVFLNSNFTYVINLAAQAGVQLSTKEPEKYVESNLIGFFNVLNLSKEFKIKHFIYASTSSVYGDNKNFPLKENENINKPLSFYAATKVCNEAMAYSFSNVYKLKATGLRFFTVYGPFGRPDMALFKFTDLILKNKKITLFNHGNHIRDFTYVDDIVLSIVKLINKPPKSLIPHNIFNIGSSNPKSLIKYLEQIEKTLGKKAKVKKVGLQIGDVHKTFADTTKLKKEIGFSPKTNIKDGINKFIIWFRNYYKK